MKKKQMLIFAMVALMLSLGAGSLLAQTTASNSTASTTKTKTTNAATTGSAPASAAAAKSAPAKAAGPPPAKGMVWVNTDSGVYHKEGSRYYGKTKQGKYMTEADAQKAGYKPSKSGS